MSLSTLTHKFLVDENVKQILLKFLESQEFDVQAPTKGSSDARLAALSKRESIIVITNDEDFQWYSDEEIYSVVLLRIPQDDSESLIKSFNKFLSEFNNFSGRIVVLDAKGWKDYPLVKKAPGLIMRSWE